MKKIVVAIGAALFILCSLYPPWVSIRGFNAGYRNVFDLPADSQYHVDLSRLFVEWVVVVAPAGVIVWMLPKKRKLPPVVGRTTLELDRELDKASEALREQGWDSGSTK